MAKKKTEEKFNLDTILFKCRDILRYFISREFRRATTIVLVSRSAFRFVDCVRLSGGAKRRHLS